ncbi:MAG: hypothetical protein F6J92_10580 [Symploca sp. SIO1A3]|nr:hypothetical protein [Symploca sp. SIO1A3]
MRTEIVEGYLIKITFSENIDSPYHWEVYNDNLMMEASWKTGGGYDTEEDCLKWAETFIRNYRNDYGFLPRGEGL